MHTQHFMNNGLLGRSYKRPNGRTEHFSANGTKLGASYRESDASTLHFSTIGERIGRSFTRNGETKHYDGSGRVVGISYEKDDGSTLHFSATGKRICISFSNIVGSFSIGGYAPKKNNVCSFGAVSGGELGLFGITDTTIVAIGFLAVYTNVRIAIGILDFLVDLKDAINESIEDEHINSIRYYNMKLGKIDRDWASSNILQDKIYLYVWFFLLIFFVLAIKLLI